MRKKKPFMTVGPGDYQIITLPVKEEERPAVEAAMKEIERRREEMRRMYANQAKSADA
jgi:hypothetical protein